MAGIPKRIFPLKRRKKRIRGFNRYLRDHQRRAAIAGELDLDFLHKFHYEYHKLGLAPWAVNSKPPLVVRRLWMGRLVADFYQWQEQLAAHYPDFYLAVWLYEPEFGRSQLVVGIEERAGRYEAAFVEVEDLPLPYEYQQLPGVANLHWTTRAEVVSYWPDEFAELGSWALNRLYWEVEATDGQSFFAVQIGRVWVGQATTPAPRR